MVVSHRFCCLAQSHEPRWEWGLQILAIRLIINLETHVLNLLHTQIYNLLTVVIAVSQYFLYTADLRNSLLFLITHNRIS